MTAVPLAQFLETARARVDAALDRCLPAPPACPEIVSEAMRYSVFAGGKRLRPVLALAAADAVEQRRAHHLRQGYGGSPKRDAEAEALRHNSEEAARGRSARPEPFDSPLILSVSPFDVAQGDPEALEGSKDEWFAQDRLACPERSEWVKGRARGSWFDEPVLSEALILRLAQDERRAECSSSWCSTQGIVVSLVLGCYLAVPGIAERLDNGERSTAGGHRVRVRIEHVHPQRARIPEGRKRR